MSHATHPVAKMLAANGAGDIAAAQIRTRLPHWRPGLAASQNGPLHSEIFAAGDEASGAGLALALARDALQALAILMLQYAGSVWL